MPVGQAVTATRTGPPGGAAAGARVRRTQASWALAAAAALGTRASPVRAPVAAGAGLTASSTSATTSSGEAAARSEATNSGRTSDRASAVSSVMCVSPAPAGAAIRKTRSAGPSGAPKSTFGESRANASDGNLHVLGAAVRDADPAGQAGR